MPRRLKPHPLALHGALWIAAGPDSLGGHGRMDLLRAVDAQGSITQAAKVCGISYKAAWDAIATMNRLAGQPLVERQTGGRGGGGTRLTPHGHALLARYAELHAVHQRFVALLDRAAFDLNQPFSLLQALNMKTTARNHFQGTVTAVRSGAVNDEVELTLASGLRIVSVVTAASTARLALETGAPAMALVKASHVLLATDLDGVRLSARNQWAGTVASVTPGAVNCEVVLQAEGGERVVAIVTEGSAKALGLAVGTRATAIVKASDVLLAVAG